LNFGFELDQWDVIVCGSSTAVTFC